MHSATQSPSPSTSTLTAIFSNSLRNLQSTISRFRPWSELFPLSSITLPSSLSAAHSRLQKNATYFAVNHAVLITLTTVLFFITAPLTLIMVSLIFACSLVFYFFRNQEDNPLVLSVGGCSVVVGDNVTFVVFCVMSFVLVVGIWRGDYTEERLIYGVGVGLCLRTLHGVFRSDEGLFLDEDQAITAGLVGDPTRVRV